MKLHQYLYINTFHLLVSYDIKLFDKIGVAIENLKDTVTVTNGFVTTQMSIELTLPTIDANATEDDCAAAANERFAEHAGTAIKKFHDQIDAELAEFIDQHPSKTLGDGNANEDDGTITVEKIKGNIRLCSSKSVTCKFHPIIDLNPDGKHGTRTQYKLRPCYNASLGSSGGLCRLEKGTGVCCSKIQSKNRNHCPNEYLGGSLSIINRHEAYFPDRTHDLGYGENKLKDIPVSRIKNYCIALLSVTIGDTKTDVGGFSDLEGSDALNLPLSRKKRSTNRNHRHRRSNWEYYAQGGFLSSGYIDGQIREVKNIAKADSNELREAVKKNSKILLTLEADKKEHDQLKTAVCSSTEHLSEALFMTELRNTQGQLEFKSEMILRSCAASIVPDQVDTDILTKLCQAKSDSHKCYGKVVRSLFSCTLTKPLITTKKVGIAFILTMQVPINEMYKAYRIHAIGVAFRNNAIDLKVNYTNVQEEQPSDNEQKIKRNELQLALKDLLLGKTARSKREILNTFHYLKLKDLPNIAIEFNGDLISFKEATCKKTPFGLLVDYSQNAATDSECIKAIFDSIVPKITHYCKVALESSNYDCIVKNMGVNGYLLSTSNSVNIQDISAGVKSVFNSRIGEKCERSVCAITVGDYDKKFQCGKRTYTVGAQPEEIIHVKSQKLEKIHLQGFTAQKGETSDLLLSGFDILDAAPIDKKILTRASTFSIVFSMLACCTIGIVVIRIICYRIIRLPLYITRWIVCLPRDCIKLFNTQMTYSNPGMNIGWEKHNRKKNIQTKYDQNWEENDSLKGF